MHKKTVHSQSLSQAKVVMVLLTPKKFPCGTKLGLLNAALFLT